MEEIQIITLGERELRIVEKIVEQNSQILTSLLSPPLAICRPEQGDWAVVPLKGDK